MTDGSDGWASPSGGPTGDEGPPRYGERVPGWTPPPESSPAPAAAPSPYAPTRTQAYAPPPKRGLIPLHPLSFGQLLGASFSVIRWNPRATIVPALLVVVLQTVLLLAGAGLFAFAAIDRLQRATTDADRLTILGGAIGGGVLIALLVFAVSVFTGALLQGMLVTVVARAAEGVRVTFGQALRAALRRVLPLIAVALLLGALQIVAVVVLVVLIALFAQIRDIGVALAILIGVLGAVGYVVAYAFFAVKLTTVPSTIVLERLGVFASIRRSWILMRGYFWRTFGLLALVLVMVGVAAQVISLPFSVLGSAFTGLLFPNAGDSLDASIVPVLVSALPASIASALVGGIGQVAQVAAVVLVYLDLRMRREGLDLELQRFVEQGGPDPLEPRG